MLGRSVQQGQSRETQEGPTPVTRRYFKGNRKRRGNSPTVKERVVCGKHSYTKALCLCEDRYPQGASSPWPD